VRSLRGRISGLCQPTYVLDIPGGYGKVPITPCAIASSDAGDGWTVEDGEGVHHAYPADRED
jgi:lysine 2,3-aminomutase